MGRIDIRARVAAVQEYADAPRVFCIRRPALIHAANEDQNVRCVCCGSEHARIVERREHLDVLVDVVTGYRSVLQKLQRPEDIDRWHAIAEASTTQVIDNPARVSTEAAPALFDLVSLVIYLMGGSQGGKTQTAAEIFWSRILLRGGIGALFIWCAYINKTTTVAVKKLATGYQGDRWIPPVIPSELVAYHPRTHRVGDQRILLHTHDQIALNYASRDGDNIKGDVAKDGVFDEASSSDHEENFTILLQRMATTGGQLIVPSTPKDPTHWLRARSEAAPTYDEIAEDPTLRERSGSARVQLSLRTNPWTSPQTVLRIQRENGGPTSPTWLREGEGLWIFTDGQRFWRTWDAAVHGVDWARREIPRGWIDITARVAREVFRGFSEDAKVTHIGGTDFNYDPYSTVVVRVLVREGDDERDPENWVLYVEDCLVKRSRSTEDYAEWVAREAGGWRGRGLAPDYFAGLHAIVDGSGFHDRARDRSAGARADAKHLRDAGWVVRAPAYHPPKNGRPAQPKNPPRPVRFGFVRELMYAGPSSNDGGYRRAAGDRRPRLLVNLLRCQELIEAFEQEVDSGKGDVKKTPGTKSDRISGITDALGYVAYALLFHRRELQDEDPYDRASGWSD